jgi:threonine/homoserine/homoserine lactone efflux protein
MFEKGILLGISLSFMIGPLLFGIIQASLEDGFKAGFSVAMGMWMSDMFFMGMILWGHDYLPALNRLSAHKDIISIAGGIVIFSFGIGSVIAAKKASKQVVLLEKNQGNMVYFLRGFILNAINPGTIFFWLGLITAAILPYHWLKSSLYFFFTGMMLSLITTDLLKIYAAKKLKQVLTPHHIQMIQTGIGVILMLFGIVLIGKEVLNLLN